MRTDIAVIVAIAASCAASSAAAAIIADYSFESPSAGGDFYYNPVVSGATFTGDAGVTTGNGFDVAPDGDQLGFLQTTADSGAEIDLSVTGLTAGSTYSFSFYDDQRNGFGVAAYTVSFDGAPLGAFAPDASGFTSRTTGSFVASGTSGILSFASPLLGYDNGVGIDDVTLNGGDAGSAVPEPATWALMLGGAGLAGSALRRRRAAELA